MRRVVLLLSMIILCLSLITNVSAASSSGINLHGSVASDGTCQISLSVTLQLEQAQDQLKFPIPASATGITLNGSRARTQKSGDVLLVDLSRLFKGVTGNVSFTVQYTLHNVVSTTSIGTQELQLPLLSGFSLPVAQMEFSVTLPGSVDAKPAFVSGYHQSNIEKDLTFFVNGATVSGITNKELKDHETLRMTLTVPDGMFVRRNIVLFDSAADDIGMIVCCVLALIYWLLFLRTLPPRREECTVPPEGYSAGEMGTLLTLKSADLSAMALSWAQLGYIVMEADNRGRIRLHKSMDMGNERSSFERQCFRILFKKDNVVDCSGYHYAQLVQKIARMQPNVQPLVHRRSGNRKIFRGICALMGLFAGISLGLSISSRALLQAPVAILFGILGLFAAWHIQPWANSLFSHNRYALLVSIGISLLWLGVSLLAGQLLIGILFLLAQYLAGFLAFYGGRRTENGRQMLSQALGLRRYLCRIPRASLQYICRNNPEYFFTMAPYAIALGVGRPFARRFGNIPLPPCPYLITGNDGGKTATEWIKLMTGFLDSMDAKSRGIGAQKLRSILKSIRR